MFIFLFLFYSKLYAAGSNARIGASLGGINLGGGLFSISYDQNNLLPQKNWTLGGELSLLTKGFIVFSRALLWQKKSIAGFYIGPEIGVGTLDATYYKTSYNGSFSDLFIGAGVEAGWTYRFMKKIDAGVGVDVMATTQGTWLGIKIMAGYLI